MAAGAVTGDIYMGKDPEHPPGFTETEYDWKSTAIAGASAFVSQYAGPIAGNVVSQQLNRAAGRQQGFSWSALVRAALGIPRNKQDLLAMAASYATGYAMNGGFSGASNGDATQGQGPWSSPDYVNEFDKQNVEAANYQGQGLFSSSSVRFGNGSGGLPLGTGDSGDGLLAPPQVNGAYLNRSAELRAQRGPIMTDAGPQDLYGFDAGDRLAFDPRNFVLPDEIARRAAPEVMKEAPKWLYLGRAPRLLAAPVAAFAELAFHMNEGPTTDWKAAGAKFSYNQDDFTLRIADAETGIRLAVPGIRNPSQYSDTQYLSYVTYKANGGQLSINDFVSTGAPDGVGLSVSSRALSSFDVTDAVTVSGRRAIDLGQSYEIGVRNLYGKVPFKQREYDAFVNGEWVSGVADNVTRVNGKNTAVEAKFVEDWNASLRNPNGQNGQYPWSVREQQKMVDQATKYSLGFEGGVIYHTNSTDLATHYSNLFNKLGIQNTKFVITPANRK